MESSEEEDIINNDEDDYGEFSQKILNDKNKFIEDKNIENLKFLNDKYLTTKKDELLIENEIQNSKKIDEKIFNDAKNTVNLEKMKRNNLKIMNKVIDLNINQNMKKQIEEINNINKEENDNNSYLEQEEKEENESENKNEEKEENENIYYNEENKNDEKLIEEKQKEIENFSNKKDMEIEINKDKENEAFDNKKEEIIARITIEGQKENNLKNSQEESGKEEENEEDEEEEEWETIKNKLIKEETKIEENNQNLKENKDNEKKEINSKEIDKENIDLNGIEKKNENNVIKVQELSRAKNLKEINIFKEEENIKSKNKTNSEYKKQESYDKDKDESIIIKDKIDLDKNFIMQSKDKDKEKKNQLNNEVYFQEFDKEKTFGAENLNEKQNTENKNTIKLGNELESVIKEIPKDLNKENKKDINDKVYKLSEGENPRRSNERTFLNKNNNLQNINISTNFSVNKKENFFSTNSFNNLLGNRTFRKFLNNKLEQTKNSEDEVPRKFIENLPLKTEKQNINKNQNNNYETLTSINYSIFYNEDNYQIPLFNKNYRRTVNERYNPSKSSNIHKNFNNRYSNDISLPQYDDNENVNKTESHRFTTSGYTHFNDNISELNLKNQKLHDKIIELENEIRISKNEMNKKNSELEKYFSSYDKMTLENNLNKEKIDELKRELKLQRGEMSQKQNKISELENMNTNLKNEMTKLQKNFDAESTMNKETKQNYDLIKSNYNDIKNQFDLLNIKYQTLTDENFNFKRDKALYERQIKTKNQMIESLIENKSNILNNKLYKLDLIEEKEESNHEMFLDYLKNKNLPNEIPKKEDKDNGMTKKKEDKNQNEDDKRDIDYSKFDKLTYPELQSKRDELVNERKNLNNIYSKIPLKNNYKGQLEKRNELEKQLNDINCDLAIIKLRMKKLKN